MAKTYVLVCQNADCKVRNAEPIRRDLEARLKGSPDVEVRPYMCFGACQAGPNIVLYPQKIWYSSVKREDVERIAAHVEGGPVVERMANKVDQSLRELIFQLLDAGLF